MGLYNIVRSKGYKQFMSKLYGWGAAVVIIGALFKINHYPGANMILIIGLGTEACIFFFSAFEPMHVEYDWSLVYPELAGMEDLSKVEKGSKKSLSLTQELDKMLEEAKIGPALIQSLGEGMKNLSENANKLGGVADAAVATDGYITNMNQASTSVKTLTGVIDRDINNTEEFAKSVKGASGAASNLTGAYNKVAESINNDISATDEYIKSVKNATASAQDMAKKYAQSAESLTKSAEAINFSGVDGKSYGEQITRISKNLSELNSIYELQLKGTSDQLDKTNKMKESMDKFLGNLNDSVESTAKYKDQVAVLAKNIAALNQVYGNMLAAMNVKTN